MDEEEWDGDEGMIIDDEGDGEDDDDRGEHASRSVRCGRGEEEDVPGISYGGQASRTSFLGRYTYSRREKDEDEVGTYSAVVIYLAQD